MATEPSAVEMSEIDELTDIALHACERAFRLELSNISRLGLTAAGLSPADGWRLNLTPNTPGYRQFVRTMKEAPSDMSRLNG